MIKKFTIAQFSDCHLFADKAACHFGAPVYQNLTNILLDIEKQKPDCCVFTGDLTQDHTVASYRNFCAAVEEAELSNACYFLPGNHDDYTTMKDTLSGFPFKADTKIETDSWQFHLLNSKSETPAGYVSRTQINNVCSTVDIKKHQFIFMHHHPVDVGYFIDRHGLKNKTEFWQSISTIEQLKGIACGHIHQGKVVECEQSLSLYTCPATSIEFESDPDNLVNSGRAPGYRLFHFYNNGTVETVLRYLK